MKQTNKIVFLLLIIIHLFSCTTESNSSVVQENTISNSKAIPFIITIYSQENILELWNFNSNTYELKSSIDISKILFLPLGIQEIKAISEHQISIDLPLDNLVSKIKPKFEFKTIILDSIISVSIPDLQQPIQKENYTLFILPSKPDEYGYFKGCISCPFSDQEMYLKSKLEWESIFGTFKEISKENISNNVN